MRPPNRKWSPFRSREMNDSSTAAEPPAAQEFDLQRAFRHDGADAHAVAPPQRRIRHPVDAFLVRQHAAVFGIDRQRLAAARDKIQRPLPFSSLRLRYDQAVRTSAYRPRDRKPPPSAIVTRCCTSTSSGLSGTGRASISRAATACRAPAASSNSRLCVGTSVSRDTRPGAWPLRPARCNSRRCPWRCRSAARARPAGNPRPDPGWKCTPRPSAPPA
jgi:hypothetical protein